MTPTIGERFGKVVVVDIGAPSKKGRRVVVLCDCGGQKNVRYQNLKSRQTASCGCLVRRHGGCGTRTYSTWKAMIARCSSPGATDYAIYGGRGISVYDRWLGVDGFKNFLSDMGERPAGTSLDRIDVNGNYHPGNCRWATQSVQVRNSRVTRLTETIVADIKFRLANGAMPRDIAAEFNVSRTCIYSLRSGNSWSDVQPSAGVIP